VLFLLRDSPRDQALALELVTVSRRDRVPVRPPRGDDVAFLVHTSGTTGTPKIVPWEQWRVAETVRNRIELSRIDESDRCVVALPLYSSAGIRRVLAGVSTGGAIICPGVLSADATIELLESLAATQYFASPASHIALLEAFERRVPRPRHGLKVIWSGTTDLPDAIRSRLERAFSVPVVIGYGMTESGSIAQTPFPPARAPAGSVGRATNIELAIVDDSGRFLGPRDSGEIVVRGPEVFAGYENDDEANRVAFRDGWFRTGDSGHIDGDGFVYLSGRLTDVVNRGGVKIVPGEVEAALARHPQVIEAAAFAVEHPTLGQDLAAAVVLRDPVPESELRRFLRDGLAAFKIPTRIVEVPELPRGSAGKVDRALLAGLVARAAGAGTEPPIGRDEAEVARIFSDVLEVPGVGRRGNFFELGGDSLNAVRVLAAVDATLGVAVTLDALFDHPTVLEFAAAIGDCARVQVAQPEAPARSKIERRT
jgi:acyl-CoA synthetase (AMP-forming)/AMP-acid ligase II/acyl carrier protein